MTQSSNQAPVPSSQPAESGRRAIAVPLSPAARAALSELSESAGLGLGSLGEAAVELLVWASAQAKLGRSVAAFDGESGEIHEAPAEIRALLSSSGLSASPALPGFEEPSAPEVESPSKATWGHLEAPADEWAQAPEPVIQASPAAPKAAAEQAPAAPAAPAPQAPRQGAGAAQGRSNGAADPFAEVAKGAIEAAASFISKLADAAQSASGGAAAAPAAAPAASASAPTPKSGAELRWELAAQVAERANPGWSARRPTSFEEVDAQAPDASDSGLAGLAALAREALGSKPSRLTRALGALDLVEEIVRSAGAGQAPGVRVRLASAEGGYGPKTKTVIVRGGRIVE